MHSINGENAQQRATGLRHLECGSGAEGAPAPEHRTPTRDGEVRWSAGGRSQLRVCPMCDRLTWWKVGDRVFMISVRNRVCGMHCDSCGGWHDDVELVGEDGPVTVDTVGYVVRPPRA